jgi:hypothetical protein
MSLTSWTAADGSVLLLDGSQGVKVQRGVAGLDGPPMFNTLDPRTAGDGSVRVHHRRPERGFTLPLILDIDVISSAEVVQAFQGPGMLTSDSGRHLQQVVYEAGLEGAWTVESGGVGELSHRKFAISLLALDPWWYSSVESLSGSFAAATAWDAPIPWDSAIPWNGGASMGIVNTGDAATPVTVVLVGQADEVSMTLGDAGWTTSAPILSGNYLTVNGIGDGRRGPHLGPHGLFAAPDGPIDWSLLEPGAQIFELPPGQSELTFGATNTDSNTAWHVFYAPRYLTP